MDKVPIQKQISFWLILIGLAIVVNDIRAYGQNSDRERPWDKVIPLVTNRYEIGDTFGKLRERDDFMDIFDAPFGIVLVWYVGAESSDGTICDWGVPKDTVTSYSISLEPILLSKIGYDLSKFEKKATHLEDVVYTDLNLGITFSATKYSADKEPEEYRVRHIRVMPRKKDIKAKCKENIKTR
jgi:hypothetical protein